MRRQRGCDERYLRLPVSVLIRLGVLALAACGSASSRSSGDTPGTSPPGVAASGYAPDGSLVLLSIARDRIDTVTEGTSKTTWVWPPVVDSHVHLAYYPVGDKLPASGIGAVVDLGAPETTLGTTAPLTVVASGPMITRPSGYPLNAWGENGYGIGCADLACVTDTIDRLAAKGAQVIKLPLDPTGLPPPFVQPAIEHAHAKGLRVAVHALTANAARVAADAGADLLAHTPAEPLDQETIDAWRGRAVISTLAAFGSPEAVKNLKKLRAAGVTVLYGTDLGNLRLAGPSADEVALLREAGLDDKAIAEAMTTVPIAYWKLPLALRQGDEATFLVLDKDPRTDASVLLRPRTVIHRGVAVH